MPSSIDSKSLESIKGKLEALQVELKNRTDKIEKDIYARQEPLNPDFAEQAVEQENSEVLEALFQEGKEELAEVENALSRLSNGTFGNCVTCKEEISLERLEVLPFTSYCRHCAK